MNNCNPFNQPFTQQPNMSNAKRRTQSSSAELQPNGLRRIPNKDRYRIVVMGSAAVGKTCIVSRLLYEQFIAEYRATVEELHSSEYELNGMPITLDVLDTSGGYEFPAMRRLSITTGDAFILVYSIDDESTFERVKILRDEIIEEKNGDERTPIVIVGNKSDVGTARRRVDLSTAETTASIDWGTGFVEVSAKDDVNISGIFKELLRQARFQMLAHYNNEADDTQPLQLQRRTKHKLTKRISCHVS